MQHLSNLWDMFTRGPIDKEYAISYEQSINNFEDFDIKYEDL